MADSASKDNRCPHCGAITDKTLYYTVSITPKGEICIGLGTNLTEAEERHASNRFWSAMRHIKAMSGAVPATRGETKAED